MRCVWLKEKIFKNDFLVNDMGMFVMVKAMGGNEGQMDGGIAFLFFFERLDFLDELLLIIRIDREFAIGIFLFYQIDDPILPIDQQIDLDPAFLIAPKRIFHRLDRAYLEKGFDLFDVI